MTKTAAENALKHVIAKMTATIPTMGPNLSKTTTAINHRFPPVELALMDIVNNKRLEAAKKNA